MEKWQIVSRLGWVMLVFLIGASACLQAFRMGKDRGKDDLLKVIQDPELQIIPRRGQGVQLILIRQIMPDDGFENRVRIDVSGFEGVEAQRLSDSSWGRQWGSHGYSEALTLWQISNTTDREIVLTESAFTNLPHGFRLKSDYHDEPVIRIEPRS